MASLFLKWMIYVSFFVFEFSSNQEKSFQRLLPKVWDPAFSDILMKDKKVVILVTAFRSGSTFFGELFNQNPDVLYDFETFHADAVKDRKGKGHFRGEDPRHTDDELNMLHLQQILHNCLILPSVFGNTLNKYWRCPKTRDQYLELYGPSEEGECNEGHWWKGPGIKIIRQYLCKKRDAAVLKVIRLRRLQDLEMIKNIKTANVKVIHLLRDPRGMFRSRGGFKDIFQIMRNQLQWTIHDKWQKLGLEAHTECENYMRDMEYGENNPWLKNRYMKIKHDDMATSPFKIAQSLYDFIGLPLAQEVKDYLKKVASIHDETGKKEETGNEDTDKGGALNTLRNSTLVNNKWLKWNYRSIMNVDKHCARFIKKMDWQFLIDKPERYFELLPVR